MLSFQTGEIALHIAIQNSFDEIVAVLVDHALSSPTLLSTHGIKSIVNSPNKVGHVILVVDVFLMVNCSLI